MEYQRYVACFIFRYASSSIDFIFAPNRRVGFSNSRGNVSARNSKTKEGVIRASVVYDFEAEDYVGRGRTNDETNV